MSENNQEDEEQKVITVSTCIVLLLILTTIIFEKTKHHIIYTAEKEMRPIFEALFGEMTTLGFVSVFAFLLSESGFFARLSRKLFGEEEELIEIFELTHYAIFFVMIAFLIEVIIMVRVGMQVEGQWLTMERISKNPMLLRSIARKVESSIFGGCYCGDIKEETLSPFRSLMMKYFNFDNDTLLYYALRKEFLLERSTEFPFEPLPEGQRLSSDFNYARYLGICMSRNLTEVVEINDFTWGLYASLTILMGSLAIALKDSVQTLAWIWVTITWCVLAFNIYFEYHLLAVRRMFIGKELPPELMYQPEGFDYNSHQPGWCFTNKDEYLNSRWFFMRNVGMHSKHFNPQEALFWFGHHGPELYITILQATVLFTGTNLAILMLIFVPMVHELYSSGLFIIYLVMTITPSVAIFLNMKHVIATLTQVCSMGNLRNPGVIATVHREDKTRDLVRTFFVVFKLRHFAANVAASGSTTSVAIASDADADLTDFEREQVVKVFRNIDRDGGGDIDKDEFRQLFTSLGVQLDDDKLDTIFGKLDADGGGTVDEQEFVNWYASTMGDDTDMSPENCATEVFQLFDRKDIGEVSLGEFNRTLREMNIGFTLDEVGDLVAELDRDGSGTVSLKEFQELVEKYFPKEIHTLSVRRSQRHLRNNSARQLT